jgi:hypothetical protein
MELYASHAVYKIPVAEPSLVIPTKEAPGSTAWCFFWQGDQFLKITFEELKDVEIEEIQKLMDESLDNDAI